MLRLNKEIKLGACKNIDLKYGSTNKNNPQVIYITAKMWICPTYDGDFKTPVGLIYKGFKNDLSKMLRESIYFDNKHILDFDINPENLVSNKKKFFSISIFVKQNNERILKLNDVSDIILTDFGYLFKKLEKALKENEFEVSKTKQCKNN